MDSVMRPARISGNGTDSSTWQAWLERSGLPELPLNERLPRHARLVVVAPHPDDEVLACGALLQRHGERGGETCIVAVTDGEASHPGLSAQERAGLAQQRRQERLRGLACMGLPPTAVRRLGLPDGAVDAHATQLTADLLALLRPQDVLVSTWAHDGHPDHEATGRVCRRLSRDIGCGFLAAPVWMWHWARPDDPLVPWRRLRGLQVAGPALERKQAALSAHRSQLAQRDAHAAVLGDAIRSRAAWPSEYYFV
jgi:LmbE family N-acetylglucosaminyl deacetylase